MNMLIILIRFYGCISKVMLLNFLNKIIDLEMDRLDSKNGTGVVHCKPEFDLWHAFSYRVQCLLGMIPGFKARRS